MGPIPAWARSRRYRAFSTEVHHAEKFTTRAQPAPIESNAVPDRPCSLTGYESGPFRALRESVRPALFGRAQSLAMPAQNKGMTDSRHNHAHCKSRETVFWWGICGRCLPPAADSDRFSAPWPWRRPITYDSIIARLASLPIASELRDFRARRCRFRRSVSATRDRSASQKSCRRRSGRCARSR